MKKTVFSAVLCMSLLGGIAIGQTTQSKWSLDDLAKKTSLADRQAWLKANVPDATVSFDDRLYWVREKARLDWEAGTLDTTEKFLAQMDAGAAKVQIAQNDLYTFYKAFDTIYLLRDYDAAETVSAKIRQKSHREGMLLRLYEITKNYEKMLPVAVSAKDWRLSAIAAINTTNAQNDKRDVIFEYSKKSLTTSIDVYSARFLCDALLKTDWTGSKVAARDALDVVAAFRKMIPPVNSESQFLKQWGELAGDLDMQIQLLEVKIAKDAAAKEDAAK